MHQSSVDVSQGQAFTDVGYLRNESDLMKRGNSVDSTDHNGVHASVTNCHNLRRPPRVIAKFLGGGEERTNVKTQ